MTVKANGIEIYYEKSGSGNGGGNGGADKSVILLHGNGENCGIFKRLSELLSPDFTVYALDTRCHGKSGGGELNYNEMAEDVAAFITALNIKRPALYGFSDGGITGLLLASKYSDMLSRLVICGANLNPKGLTRLFLGCIKIMHFFSRSKKLALMLKQPDISAAELAAITVPVLVLAGEKDIVKKEHTAEIARGVNNARLQILKGENHQSYVEDNEKLYGIIEGFLKMTNCGSL